MTVVVNGGGKPHITTPLAPTISLLLVSTSYTCTSFTLSFCPLSLSAQCQCQTRPRLAELLWSGPWRQPVHMNLKIFTLKSGCGGGVDMVCGACLLSWFSRGRKLSAAASWAWHWHGISMVSTGISVTVTWIMSTFF